ncbi:cyclopropane-fatty-acyl-phospholipid synthase family protein [Opitutales bacterium]|nr:cyclopropane-fatty-acyl-phospholipid synthase family protein [Opitutales bacterium]
MTNQERATTERDSPRDILKAGFFEKILSHQLKLSTTGILDLNSPSGKKRFGNPDNGGLEADLQVHKGEFFRKACLGGSLGVADSYSNGDWDTADLVSFFRFFLQNQEVMDGMESGWATLLNKLARWAYLIGQKNTIQGSRKNISLHYDLGNDFYELMLDPTMTYSCGIFESENSTLEEASLAKYDRIIDQLKIEPHHHVLEIGCGWGGFAERLAQRTDARLTATTISSEQFKYAENRINNLGASDRITIVKQDYRNLSGVFDRVVSIEMIEAVGHEYLPTYFSKIAELLSQNGAAIIQAITMPDHRYSQYLKEVDYIRTRVFPGSNVPSVSAMVQAVAKKSDLRPTNIFDFGYHYARTLREWRLRFLQNEDKIARLGYDQSFRRAWLYYLCYCEAGFEEGYTGDVHLLLTKPESKLSKGFPE